MKKNGFKVLTLALMLALGTSALSAYAAEGWAMSNNAWTYLDAKGNKVRDEWRKGADNLWRYLNYKGEMAISTWVDDEYYVDSNGIMVNNQWVKTKPQYDSKAEETWFYFGSSGKMAKDGWKKIDGKNYLFDGDGVMQTGWTEDGLYYLGDDGAVKTGWKHLVEPEGEDYEWDSTYAGPESADGKYWFYFGSNGKKYCPESSGSNDLYKVVKISGDYYCFDEHGRMMTGWVYLNGDADDADSDTIEGWRYFAESGISGATLGTAVKGWLSLVPPSAVQDEVEEDVVWYYFSANGTPEAGPEKGKATTSDFTRINSKSYLFDALGNPVSGLHKVQIGSTGEYTAYYFDQDSKLALTGKQTVEEADGTESTFYFNESSYAGRGFTGVKNNYLYYMGKRQQADEGMKYAAITIDDNGVKKTYVVNESGRVTKSKEVKDYDGTKFKTDANGILTHENGSTVGSKVYESPNEPVFEDWD